jgi:hypothetical protein
MNGVGEAVARFYPAWAKKDLDDRGYVVDNRPARETVPPPPSNTIIETLGRNYPNYIKKAFAEARGKRLTIPG